MATKQAYPGIKNRSILPSLFPPENSSQIRSPPAGENEYISLELNERGMPCIK